MPKLRRVSPKERKFLRQLQTIPVERVLSWMGLPVELAGSEFRTRCPDPRRQHKNRDSNPSLSVAKDGKFYCFVCGTGGRDIVQFVMQHTGQPREKVLRVLCDQFVHPVVPDAAVDEAHNNLLSNGLLLAELERTRGITPDMVRTWRLGLENDRITIPVGSAFGFWCDLRRWNAFRLTGVPKTLPYAEGYGKHSHAHWWPIDNTRQSTVVVCEGEGDTLRAMSLGKNAVTAIGGCRGLMQADWSWVSAKSVTFIPHNDPAGRQAALEATRKATQAGVARWRVLSIPEEYEDLDDWVAKAGPRPARRAFRTTPWTRTPSKKTVVSLEGAVSPKLEGLPITIEGQVASVQSQPLYLPHRFRVTCTGDAGLPCVSCPQASQDLRGVYELDPANPLYLDVLFAGKKELTKTLLRSARVPETCNVPVEVSVLSHQAALPVRLIPAARQGTRDIVHVTREAVLPAHHITPGTTARFSAITRQHPKNHQAVTVLREIQGNLSPHREFTPPEGMHETLLSIYADRDPLEAVLWTAEVLATHYTRVAGRTLMHAVMDLAFHSILELPYGGVVEGGFLDVLVFGATSTGKGRAAEGLLRVYQLGEILSGKRCSTPGLIGGTVRHPQGFDVVPGAWPLAHEGLCIMDEAVSPEVFASLTRARREGIAEFTQAGVSQAMPAMVRKIWIMNPPGGTTLDDYRYGAELIRVLGGTEEDTTRWDIAVGVAPDVTPEEIDRAIQPKRAVAPIPAEILRAKVRWSWSRRPSHVRWTAPSRRSLSHHVGRLVERFGSARVGLIQPGNTHTKLRKLSAAVAALTYSSPDSQTLVIDSPHVDAAASILTQALSSPTVRLDELTRIERETGAIGDERAVLAALRKAKDYKALLKKVLLLGSAPLRVWQATLPSHQSLDILLRERALVLRTRDIADVTRPFADLIRRELKPKLKRRTK